jgi:NAD dependent epimerase/dehydratase family
MKNALVAGALGVTGRAIVNHLVSLGDWEVIGLSRRSPEFQTTAKYISVDLLSRPDVEACFSEIGDARTSSTPRLNRRTTFSTRWRRIWQCWRIPWKWLSDLPGACGRSCSSRAPSSTARTSVPTRLPRRRVILATCRRIFITIKRTTSWNAQRERRGPGHLSGRRLFAASRWEIP